MRQPEGCKLTPQEWTALQATGVKQSKSLSGDSVARGRKRSRDGGAAEHEAGANLEGTEEWYQCAYG